MDDDVMPNDGTYFLPREPQDQIIARQKERAKTLEAAKVIDGVIAHFEERIAQLSNIDSITESLDTDPIAHQKAFHVRKLVKQALEEEKSLLEDLLSVHAPNR